MLPTQTSRKNGLKSDSKVFGLPLESLPLTSFEPFVPKVLQDMINNIAQGLNRPTLFIKEPKSIDLGRVLRLYETEFSVNLDKSSNPYLTSAVLLHFLRTLPEPLITLDIGAKLLNLQASFIEIGPRVHATRRLIKKLPELNYYTLHQIVELLFDIVNADDRIKEDNEREESLLDFLRDTAHDRSEAKVPKIARAMPERKESMLDFLRDTEIKSPSSATPSPSSTLKSPKAPAAKETKEKSKDEKKSKDSKESSKESSKDGPIGSKSNNTPTAEEALKYAELLADVIGPAAFQAYEEPRRSLAQQVTAVLILRFVNIFMEKEAPPAVARDLPDPIIQSPDENLLAEELFPWLCNSSLGLLFRSKNALVTSVYDVKLDQEWTTEFMMSSFRRSKLETQLLNATPESFMYKEEKPKEERFASPERSLERSLSTSSVTSEGSIDSDDSKRKSGQEKRDDLRRRPSYNTIGEQRVRRVTRLPEDDSPTKLPDIDKKATKVDAELKTPDSEREKKDRDRDKEKDRERSHDKEREVYKNKDPTVLAEEYKSVLKEKSELQKVLNQYQDEFEKQNGRKIKYKQDTAPIKDKYDRYKEIKTKLKYIEGALGLKKDTKEESQ